MGMKFSSVGKPDKARCVGTGTVKDINIVVVGKDAHTPAPQPKDKSPIASGKKACC